MDGWMDGWILDGKRVGGEKRRFEKDEKDER
jgi:hypothetical protein